MGVIYGLDNVSAEPNGRAIAVGVFDGVHLGHQLIFQQLLENAAKSNLRPAAFTFDKHPAELLAPAKAPYYINTLDQRIELIKSTGVDEIIVAEFNPELANMPSEDFTAGILRDKLNAKHVVVGTNFKFGKDRAGDVQYLAQVTPGLGMELTIVPALIIDGAPVSSTRIRMLIKHADMPTAAKLLGRLFTLSGTVVEGRKIGRTIGFPTANIQTNPRQLVPPRGVYAVEAVVEDATYSGVCSIGCRPTFNGKDDTIEVHLMEYQGNIYGEQLDTSFCGRLRDEIAFESPEKLVEQIKLDVAQAQQCCNEAKTI